MSTPGDIGGRLSFVGVVTRDLNLIFLRIPLHHTESELPQEPGHPTTANQKIAPYNNLLIKRFSLYLP